MNPSDDDLDCLLKTWTAPRSPDSLEARLRRAYGHRLRRAYRHRLRRAYGNLLRRAYGNRLLRRAYGDRAPSRTTVLSGEAGPQRKSDSGVRTRWIAQLVPTAGTVAGVMAGAVVLLAVITRAFPQSLNLVVPAGAITLDTEFLDYKDDGSYTVREYRSSFFKRTTVKGDFLDGEETVLSSSFPDDPLRTAAESFLNPIRAILDPIAHRAIDPLFFKPHRAEYLRALEIALAARIHNGCTPSPHWGTPMTVIGKETVLDYTTTVSQYEFKDERFTEWFAPGLDCFSLRSTTEKALPDGAFRLATERRVLKVTKSSTPTAGKEPAQ